MNTQEALAFLTALTSKITNKDVQLTLESDLKKDGVLDSVDSLVFFLELDAQAGLSVPETADLVAEGYYNVGNLVTLLARQQEA